MTKVNTNSGSILFIGLNAWSNKLISIVLKTCGIILLKMIADTLSWMIDPKLLETGNVYKIWFGIEYLDDIRLQQKIILFIGFMTGVNVERYWIFVALKVSG